MKPTYIETLQKTDLFSGIDKSGYKTLISCLSPHIKSFAKNEIILMSGEAVHHIGIFISGTANAYLEDINGSQTIMSRLKPLSVFGEILVSTRNHKSPVTIYATSEVIIAFIEYERLLTQCSDACTAHNILIKNMLKVIGDKYFRLFDRINILREKSLRDKIWAYLHTLGGKDKKVTIPMSKTLLADYLLANRSALSKELRKMADEGLITVSGREIKFP
ncbi:MAG: Crp/Fnr family transcriptional regulator [Defluviitaleaceae bacterium]|nr:Crp/Fnr family transcriptional regulator [Defluviitaleaceae bacterium]